MALTIAVESGLKPPSKLWDTVPPNEFTKKVFGHAKVFSTSVDKDLVISQHPVLQGFINAYREHRPVTISPDIIWLLIIQGFSHHVNKNAEKLRTKFVNFEGQKELTVNRIGSYPETCPKCVWEGMFSEFVETISSYTGPHLTDILTPSFSTTTPTSLAVGQISIMSSLQKYFKYRVMMGGCGFPSVTIEGTIEDWEKILYKLTEIEKYDLFWWTSEMVPVINEIINTKNGKIDTSFWKQMIRYKDGTGFYDPSYADGWFMKFFPYDAYGSKMSLSRIYNTKDVPEELLTVPFKLVVLDFPTQKPKDAPTFDCEFVGGFVGLSQSNDTFNVKPEIGWVIKIADKKKLHPEM